MKKSWLNGVCGVVLLVIGFAAAGWADTTTWTGNVTNDWFIGGNWDNGVPGPGSDAIIGLGADVLLTNATAHLNSLTMSGGTLTFSNWYAKVEATNVTISGGTVTLPPAFVNNAMSNRVWFVCASNFSVASGASIDADGKGYARAIAAGEDGHGPGGGHSCSYGSGAGHGGKGGDQGNALTAIGGVTYGSYSAPVQPGSGGATRSGQEGSWVPGDGGGAVRISAGGKATIDGNISVDGVRNGIYSGGGAGGSVYVDCHTFAGSGTISADGNSAHPGGGGGGGGRIAVVYNTSAQASEPAFAVTFTAKGGIGQYPNILARHGQPGTIYFPDTPFLTETISLAHAGRLMMPGTTNWAPGSLTVSAACDLVFPDDFNVTVTNDCRIDLGSLDLGWGSDLRVGGTVTLTNNGTLKIRSAATNGGLDYGVLLSVTNDINIADGAWLYLYSDPTNGGAPLVMVRNVRISSSDAGISADYGGFRGGADTSSQDGYGPGGGGGASYGGGGGYGGKGSYANNFKGWSVTYGSATNVVMPGSGGGSYASGNGGEGGGLIRIVASSNVVVVGALSADAHGGNFYSGGGSGGGIDVTCHTLTGTGTIRANGGNKANTAGGGGGGRIAIHYNAVAQSSASPMTILFSAAPGLGTYAPGEKGTVYFPPVLQEQVALAHIGKFALPGISSWSPTSITVNAACDIELPADFEVSITHDVLLNGGTYCFGVGSDVFVGKNVVLTNAGALVVRSGPTNSSGSSYGALVDVSGDMLIYANSWLYPYCDKTNGAGALIRVNSLSVLDASAGIDADGLGFLGGNHEGYGNDGQNGLGPGAGLTISYGGGGGHGGAGGDSSGVGSGGPTNGYASAPYSGSGGAEGASGGIGGNGGGQIRIEAGDAVLMNGTMTADGEDAGYYAGGGSGGGIWIIAKTFSGSGTLSAEGGNSNNKGGAGGGGRIAVWHGGPYGEAIRAQLEQDQTVAGVTVTNEYTGFAGTLSVTNGILGQNPGELGTVAFLYYEASASGTAIIIR